MMEKHLILFKGWEAFGFPFTHFCDNVYDLNVFVDLLIIGFILDILILTWIDKKRERNNGNAKERKPHCSNSNGSPTRHKTAQNRNIHR